MLFSDVYQENSNIKYAIFIVWVIKHLRCFIMMLWKVMFYLVRSVNLWSVWDNDDLGVIRGYKWELINIIICIDYQLSYGSKHEISL